jgi:tetrahydromethanopterin S-methyltransferase subunit G
MKTREMQEHYCDEFVNYIMSTRTIPESIEIDKTKSADKILDEMFDKNLPTAKDFDDFANSSLDETIKERYEKNKLEARLYAIEAKVGWTQSETLKTAVEKDDEKNPIERDRKLGITLEPIASEYMISKLFQHRTQQQDLFRLNEIKERLKRQAKQNKRLEDITEKIHAIASRLIMRKNISSLSDDIDEWERTLKPKDGAEGNILEEGI